MKVYNNQKKNSFTIRQLATSYEILVARTEFGRKAQFRTLINLYLYTNELQ